jgi:hypothetical protein
MLLSGCSSHSLTYKFKSKAKHYGVNYRTLMAICKKESQFKSNVINVNKSIFDIQKGPHYFDNWFTANLYMDTVLDPLGLNYDIGICQINSQHLDKFNIDNEDLLDDDINIEMAAKIYLYNVRQCKGRVKCALCMYNTGKKKSKIGLAYANHVLRIRKTIK